MVDVGVARADAGAPDRVSSQVARLLDEASSITSDEEPVSQVMTEGDVLTLGQSATQDEFEDLVVDIKGGIATGRVEKIVTARGALSRGVCQEFPP